MIEQYLRVDAAALEATERVLPVVSMSMNGRTLEFNVSYCCLDAVTVRDSYLISKGKMCYGSLGSV